MAYDRPSWKEIDGMRDGTSGRRGRRRAKEKNEMREHSTRYDKYKADLNRLFDQGLAGELVKGAKDKEAGTSAESKKGKKGKAILRHKGNGRIPTDTSRSTSRLKLIRAIVDAQDPGVLQNAIDELVERFGLPGDWGVLARVLEHTDEELVGKAVMRMGEMLPAFAKVPRRASLKERLRTIGQTASDSELRRLAGDLESRL